MIFDEEPSCLLFKPASLPTIYTSPYSLRAEREYRLDRALARLDGALALVDVQVPDAELAAEGLAAACQYTHPVCGLLYAVVARRHAGSVLTRDQRLTNITQTPAQKALAN